MLNVACVCVGEGYSPAYVEILHAMVRRNLKAGTEGRFTVFTDKPENFKHLPWIGTRLITGLEGWWAKLALFSPGAFPKGERVWYFDLDTVIVGPLDEIFRYPGAFAILKDAYRPNGMQSSVMSWIAGSKLSGAIWNEWNAHKRPMPAGGDQEVLEIFWEKWLPNLVAPFTPDNIGHCNVWPADRLQDLFPDRFKSFKADRCHDAIPKASSVIFFHGRPRPHEVLTGWVPMVWNVEGGSPNELVFACNATEDDRVANVRDSIATAPAWLKMREVNGLPAIIVGGGPSLEENLWRIRGFQKGNYPIFAVNNAYKALKDFGIEVDGHVMVDARPENAEFVPPLTDQRVICYYASQTAKLVRELASDRLVCWHPYNETYKGVIGADPSGEIMVGGGSSSGVLAVSIASILGFRKFLIFGFDSSYRGIAHHAYPQALNEGEHVISANFEGTEYRCAGWMVEQAEQFTHLARDMMSMGSEFMVYGTGLLPDMMNSLDTTPIPPDLRANAILKRLEGVDHPVIAEIGVFTGDLSKRLLARRPDLTLYMVDRWEPGDEGAFKATDDYHSFMSPLAHEGAFTIAKNSVYFAHDRAKILRAPSLTAVNCIANASLDLVFIDADHSYEGCLADLQAWWPKIRPGGYLSGHDYGNDEFPKFGVTRAVDEFCGPVELGDNFTFFKQKDDANGRTAELRAAP